jgi:protein-disulfide isomerase
VDVAQSQRKGKQGGGNKAFYVVLGVIGILGVMAIGYATVGSGGSAATEPISMELSSVRELYDQATPVTLGPPDAPVKVVEFADFQCPGCGAFSLQVRPRVKPYIESGVAQLVYYDFPLGGSHVHSFLAARAARCGGEQALPPGANAENAYWLYHDKLYAEQATWSRERDVVDEFIDYGEEIGLDGDALASCIRSDRFADVVTANRMLGQQLGVSSTPTVLVNNRRVPGSTIQAMGDNLVQMLEEARQARTGDSAGGE